MISFTIGETKLLLSSEEKELWESETDLGDGTRDLLLLAVGTALRAFFALRGGAAVAVLGDGLFLERVESPKAAIVLLVVVASRFLVDVRRDTVILVGGVT